MQTLGPNAPLRRHEQDLLYAGAACKAHENPDIQAVGDAFLARYKELRSLRAEYEDAEDGVVLAEALTNARDHWRDNSLVSLGKFADSIGAGDRAKLFRLPPSDIARLGYAAESQEISSTLTRLRQYPEGHPLRAAYEERLGREQDAFSAAIKANDEAEQRLTGVRFAVLNAKLANDTFRDQQFGALAALTNRRDADAFFRNWRAAKDKQDKQDKPSSEPPSA